MIYNQAQRDELDLQNLTNVEPIEDNEIKTCDYFSTVQYSSQEPNHLIL